MKRFVLIAKILIVLSLFVVANITKGVNIETANAIAGVMAVISMFVLFVLDSYSK